MTIYDQNFFSSLECVPEALHFVLRCASCKLPQDALMKIELAVEEVLTNIIRYANLSEKASIHIACKILPHQIEIDIKDSGIHFDPTEKVSINAIGTTLIQNLMDEIRYKRAHGMNHLTLIKKAI